MAKKNNQNFIRMSDIPDASTKAYTKKILNNWNELKKREQRIEDFYTQCSPRQLWEVLPDNAWKGQRCFIVGGGASLKDFDFEILKDELTIGINMAFMKFNPTLMFSTDSRLFEGITSGKLGKEVQEKYRAYKGLKVWLNVANYEYPQEVYTLNCCGEQGFPDTMKIGLGHGSNSGYSALNLAYQLGANPIYLLGYDMKGDGKGKQKWFHNYYPWAMPEASYIRMIKNFDHISNTLKEKEISVINLNNDSKLRCFPISEINQINKNTFPIIISYYTKNTLYQDLAKRLTASLDRLHIVYDIEGIDDLGSWQKNTYYKAKFIRRKMEEHPDRDIVFIDCDAIVWEYPELFKNLDCDLAVHYFQWKGKEYASNGTLFIKNNEQMRGFVDEWIAENENRIMTNVFEQKVMQDLMASEKWASILNIKKLPKEYCYIVDLMKVGKPVIHHFQASRLTRS